MVRSGRPWAPRNVGFRDRLVGRAVTEVGALAVSAERHSTSGSGID